MPGLSFLVVWAGYSLFVYGYTQVRSCNIKWVDLSWPGRFAKSAGCQPDSGSKLSYQQSPNVGGQTTGNATAAQKNSNGPLSSGKYHDLPGGTSTIPAKNVQ